MLRSYFIYLILIMELVTSSESASVLKKRNALLLNPCHSSPDSLSHPWPNGIIPYHISSAVPNSLRSPLHFALQKVENMSCVQFLPRTTQSDYVLIEYGERCCSHNGAAGPGPQLLYVSEVCINENETLAETVSKLANVVVPHQYCQSNCGDSRVIFPGSAPGWLKSPGKPLYPPNSNCVWRIWTPAGNSSLKLHFDTIRLEEGQDCLFDYLQIFQEDATGRIINETKLCGSHTNYQMITSNFTNVVSIHFRSDESTEREGFTFKYSLINDQVKCIINNGGCSHICNSDSQGVKMSCSCRPGYQLSRTDNTTCIDINECHNASICHQKCINTVGSYYCHCRQGYSLANNSRTCQVCSQQLNTSQGLITPSELSYQNCKWTITIWPGHYLNITLQNIDIYNSSSCSEDYLRPGHGRFKNKKRLCGRYKRIQYILHGSFSKTYFRFYSGPPRDEEQMHRGFEITFQQIPIYSVTRSELKTVNVNGNQIGYNSKYWL